MRAIPLYAALCLLAAASLLLAVMLGSMALTPGEVMAVLAGGGEALHRTVILELRLSRALAAFATGGLLAVAGALMQVLLRNPLADPYVLGVSGGAAMGALLAMLAGLGAALVSGSAFAGALLSTFLVFGLARGRGAWTSSRLLLTGIVVAAGWGAMIGFVLSVAPRDDLPGMLFWLMGDLGRAGNPWPALGVLALGLAACWPLGRSLNLIARGPLQAASLGIPVRAMEMTVYVTASLLTAVAVTLAGTVGFVGLVIPHMIRLLIGNDQRKLLPASALAGGALVVIADTLARTAMAPQQLPVGVITALIGVPTFLYLLNRRTAGGRT